MMREPILTVKNLSVQQGGKTLLDDLSFTVQAGEHWVITGPSGSGKSLLLSILAGTHYGNGSISFHETESGPVKRVLIPQQHHFRNKAHLQSFYYQQRFNSADAEDTCSVEEALMAVNPDNTSLSEALLLLGITHIRSTPLIQLSNGEHKRVQLAKAMLLKAGWLFLDNPYVGLDKEARLVLNDLLDTLAASGIQFIIVTQGKELPSCITHVLEMTNGRIAEISNRISWEQKLINIPVSSENADWNIAAGLQMPELYESPDFTYAIRMVNTTVAYHGKKILDAINWEVKKGERWNVSGHNGSGKSTLISLINGDNPQAFANEIYLFDRRKGSGETIWEIKQKIGFVSPELHHYFDSAASSREIVASGIFDTIGLFRKPSAKQWEIVDSWMELLKIQSLSRKLFRQISEGEQRMVLLARALVKNPPLLLLDEPCQGLDAKATARFTQLINEICLHMKKTLVYVSHYSEEVPPCVTKSLQLKQGKMAA